MMHGCRSRNDRRRIRLLNGADDVPASMQSNEQLEIKIGKGNEKVTPHIYEVRLVAE